MNSAENRNELEPTPPSLPITAAQLVSAPHEDLDKLIALLPQIDLQTQHGLSGGIYWRVIFIPKNTALTGGAVRRDHVNVGFGDITVSTPDGPKRFTGFFTVPGRANFNRAGHAHADTYWVSLFHTDKTVLKDIEDELVYEPERLQTRKQADAGLPINQLESTSWPSDSQPAH